MSGGPYALGIDFGTESVRVGIFDMEGTPVVFTGETYALTHLAALPAGSGEGCRIWYCGEPPGRNLGG